MIDLGSRQVIRKADNTDLTVVSVADDGKITVSADHGLSSGAPVTYRRGIGLRLTMLSVSNSTYYAVPVPGDSKSFYLVASATDVSDASKRLAVSLTSGGFYDAGASVHTAVANSVAGTRYQSGNALSVTGGGTLTVSEVNFIQNQLVFANPHGLSDGAEVTYSAANPGTSAAVNESSGSSPAAWAWRLRLGANAAR